MLATAVVPSVESPVSSAMTTRIVLVVEYDGTHYHGSQLQSGLPTIQGEIEKALGKLTGEKTRVTAASRTDAGVHARGQIFSFRTTSLHSLSTFVKGMNYYLPEDIAVKAAHQAGDSFNARRHAVSREYRYQILNTPARSPLSKDFACHVIGRLELGAMNQACRALIGEHDFASFASDIGDKLKNTVRRVYRAELREEGELTIFDMVANSFLPHQVRNTVGTLIRVGLGKMSIDEFCSIMGATKLGLAGPAVPACGLCLIRVNYAHSFEEEI